MPKTKVAADIAKQRKAKPKTKAGIDGARSRATKPKARVGLDDAKPRSTKPRAPRKVGKAVALEMMELLRKTYPEADCELDYGSDFQLLIAVILSAQTTDANVNRITPKLFERFPTADALATGDIEEIKEIVRPSGYYNAKATNIQACARALVERFGGKVPQTLEELITLPGVGRKTANVVLGVVHDIPGWTVDTHVQRLSQRLGFTKETDPYKIELDLQKLFPARDWSLDSITLIWHGRRICFARNPNCPGCPINHLCPSSLV